VRASVCVCMYVCVCVCVSVCVHAYVRVSLYVELLDKKKAVTPLVFPEQTDLMSHRDTNTYVQIHLQFRNSFSIQP
jgi:hypothetical protein